MRSVILAGVTSSVLAGVLNVEAGLWISTRLEPLRQAIDGDPARAEAFWWSLMFPWRSMTAILFWLPFLAAFSIVGAVAAIVAIRTHRRLRWAGIAATGVILVVNPLLVRHVTNLSKHVLENAGLWPKLLGTSCIFPEEPWSAPSVIFYTAAMFGAWLLPLLAITIAQKQTPALPMSG